MTIKIEDGIEPEVYDVYFDVGLNIKDNVTINIYGGNNQVIPDVKEVEQHIYTEDGETIVINKFKVK